MRDLKLKVRYPKRFKVTTDSHHKRFTPCDSVIYMRLLGMSDVHTTEKLYMKRLYIRFGVGRKLSA